MYKIFTCWNKNYAPENSSFTDTTVVKKKSLWALLMTDNNKDSIVS